MKEIEFSVMVINPEEANRFQPLLKTFEEQFRIRVKLIAIPWTNGWTEIAKFGIFGDPPDISTIGQTWVGSLAAMSALRPFTPAEIHKLGGADSYFEPSWRSGFLPDDPSLWAVPWISNVLVLYYWKDILEEAGIHDFDAAFATEAALFETLAKLQNSGYAYPMALNTQRDNLLLHEAAPWLWRAGGDFISDDNRRVIFNQPEALQGLEQYFRLQPFVSPDSQTDGLVPYHDFFDTRKAVVHFEGCWPGTIGRVIHPEWNERLGVAALPGKSLVGGSSLVIWKDSSNYSEAFELARFLSSQPVRIPASPYYELPARSAVMGLPSASQDVFYRTLLQSIQNGRCFPTVRLWGSIEDKLITALARIWEDLFSDPHLDLDACLHKYLDPLANRLNRTLEG